MAKVLNKLPGGKIQDIDSFITSLKRLIVKTLEVTIKFPVAGQDVLPPLPYKFFIELLSYLRSEAQPRHTVSVLTFNYDIALDYAFYVERIAVDYALEPESQRGAVPLLKLHGSLNWGVCSNCKKIIPWNLMDYFHNRSWHPFHSNEESAIIDIGSNLKNHQHCNVNLLDEPVLVPPTWNKSEHHATLSSVWSRAAKELAEAENIFVIGYSLPDSDAFFRYLYGLGTVGDFPLKRFWVFDPDETGGVKSRFEALLGSGARSRFRPFRSTFDESISVMRNGFRSR